MKNVYANWQISIDDSDYNGLLEGTLYEGVFQSLPYNQFLKVVTDDETYLDQLKKEYVLKTHHKRELNTFIYLTKQTDKKQLLQSGSVQAFVNLDKHEIVINGVNHYGYFKSVLLGAYGFFDELNAQNNVSIHAALISINEEGIMFIAPSGKGKSTYSIGLREEKGYALVSDDWIILDCINKIGKRGDIAIRIVKDYLDEFMKTRNKIKYLYHQSDSKIELMPNDLFFVNFKNMSPVNKIILLERIDDKNYESVLNSILSSSYHVPFNYPKEVDTSVLPQSIIKIIQNRKKRLISVIKTTDTISLDIFERSVSQNLDFLRGILKHE